MSDQHVHVCVVGAGTMGRGIAQVAVAAGHPVSLVDPDSNQLASARDEIAARLSKRDPRGLEKVDRRLGLHSELSSAPADEGTVVIEAVLEDVSVKQSVFRRAVEHFGASCILATNTSSLSVTAIASAVQEPSRTVGMHFFNPVPAMKLVEVVRGLQTDDAVVATITELAQQWGKTVVQVRRSTPGFIVNRVARGFYGEALRLLEEGSAPAETIDEIARASGGFRMGPFELLDLIGNDVNSVVNRMVWTGYNFDPRFAPSLIQDEMVAAGRFGRKSGQGFYDYGESATRSSPSKVAVPPGLVDPELVLHGQSYELESLLERAGATYARSPDSSRGRLELVGLGTVVSTRGLTAAQESQRQGGPTLVIDRCLDPTTASAVAVASSSTPLVEAVARLLARGDVHTYQVDDLPGLVLARILAVIANEAWWTAHQGVATSSDVDLAMRLGTNYPLGPFEWTTSWSPSFVVTLLDALWDAYHDPRYRASQALRAAAG